MLSIAARTIPRRVAAAQTVRTMAKKAAPTHGQGQKKVGDAARQAAASTPGPVSAATTKLNGAPSPSPAGASTSPADAATPPPVDSIPPADASNPPPPLDSIPEPTPAVDPFTTAAPSSNVPSLDFSPLDHPRQDQEPGRTGARSSKGSLSSTERRRRFMGQVSLALMVVAFAGNAVYMGREWEEDELKNKRLTRENAPATRWGRTKERFMDLFDYFNKPAWPELLPPPYPPPHQKPYTLLISLDDLLITSTWDRQHGWRTAKRPGVDYFLAYISQFYEVVIFTSQNYYTAGPVLDKLDRYNFYINHRLFREATRSINGKIVKDLSYLNRDLNKVVLLDTDPDHISTHPENAILLPKWKGDPKDKGLVAMIPFLESIAIYKPADVRPILEAYAGKDIPIEYGKKEAEAKARHVEEWKNKHGKGVAAPSIGSWFGISAGPASPRNEPPATYLEQKRREAQAQYKEEQKYIQEHKEELEKLLQQDQEAMAAQVPGNLWEAIGGVSAGAKGAEGLAAPTPGTPGAAGSAQAAAKGVEAKKA
ncbi:HAD-like domain-containing protein [Crucibulum laeve]|uniref:Mitochondrial import inner membrane translocase subunit TIM50 n=1 Tax=Crucibulum laeve TaxID=68775 RepID=A0A5C3LVP0_9AGAR|nr:HAD-like domain-containing protein [Crucibulum laeve]